MVRMQPAAIRTRLVLGVCALAVAAAAEVWAADGPAPFRTGLFGVTPDQTVRISIVNTGDVKGTITPAVSLLDPSGAVLVERRGRSLAEGVGSFADFTSREGATWLGGAVPGVVSARARAQVRAEVAVDYQPIADDGRPISEDAAAIAALRRNVRLTLEVFDTATGRTLFTMPFDAVGFDPQPDPPAPAVR